MKNMAKLLCVVAVCVCIGGVAIAQDLTPKEELGKHLFFDAKLSTPPGMSCATCHAPSAAFADPRGALPTSPGVIPNRCGNRNSPMASYAFGGPQALELFNGGYAGGAFWDGRADNLVEQAKGPFLNRLEMNNPGKMQVILKVRRSPYAPLFRTVYGPAALVKVDAAYNCVADAISTYEQSSEVSPFSSKMDAFLEGKAELSPMERMGMMLFHGKAACSQCHNSGRTMGRTCPGGCACGCAHTGVCKCADCNCGCPTKGEIACSGGCKCGCAVTGVCTCGPSCTCGCLQSDANLCAGGCACGCAFTGVCNCGPMCQCGCPSTPTACDGGCTCGCWWTHICNCGAGCDCGCPSGGMANGKPLLTNHGYFNLGTPANPFNPFYTIARGFNPAGYDFVDTGLGHTLLARGVSGAGAEMGKFKVPSLRNCAMTAPYMHNGVFTSLRQVIEFYNTRDVPGAGWGPPEVDHPNIFRGSNYGNLGLTPTEIDALVAFLEAFTDGYEPGPPPPPM